MPVPGCVRSGTVPAIAGAIFTWTVGNGFSMVAGVRSSPPTIVFEQHDEGVLASRASPEVELDCTALREAIEPQHAMSSIRQVWSTTVNPELAMRNAAARATRPMTRYVFAVFTSFQYTENIDIFKPLLIDVTPQASNGGEKSGFLGSPA